MRSRSRGGLGAVFSALAALPLLADAGAPSPPDDARAFLATTFQLSTADLERIDKGEVLARTQPASDAREVATVGVVRMRITPEFYVEQLADMPTFKKDEAVLQIGVFGTPAVLPDVSELTLDESDIRSLRRCRVGSCGVQLPADAIDRFRRDMDWQREDAPQRANLLMRQILVDYVAEYQQRGAAAPMRYADRAEPLDLGREFAALAASDGGAWDRFPDLRRHLLAYPDARTPGTVDLLYWSKEVVGRRTVSSVTHVAIARGLHESAADYTIASKHIYGTHYYDASLGLTILLRDRSRASAATYVAYVNRSRVDVFTGMLGALTRKIVTVRARTTVSNQLARLQRSLEHKFAVLSTD